MSQLEKLEGSALRIEEPRVVSGWGRTPRSLGRTLRVDGQSTEEKEARLSEALSDKALLGVVPRGLGRSYGDSATLAAGLLSDPEDWKDTFELDPHSSTLEVSSGFSLDEIMRKIVPRGFFVPVTPGTRYVTVGGAIASDIHGKNHHVEGSFAKHIRSMTLVSPTGIKNLCQDDNEFKATAGGMGLTGFVSKAVIDLIPIKTSKVFVTTKVTKDLAETVEELKTNDSRYRYSVAWIDCMAKGGTLGRSVITWGEHLEDLDHRSAEDPLHFDPKFVASIPDIAPSWLLNKFSVRVFNELWYRKGKLAKETSIESIETFFHPLDMVGDWNRLYGQKGFLQYQFVIPFEAEATLERIVKVLSDAAVPSFLAVLKRFGPESGNYMSFPKPGWTLALDIPAHRFGLGEMLDALDAMVVAEGGRVYLAKDSRVSKELIAIMYPELKRFQETAEALDPNFIFQSDMSRRLGLRG
ncbi:decaprenylphospho-beta-D-ribofuranose 2-oxidase [Ferrithrix thermotolerans DSM 19514]|uniref:Decaprenylphospho-beta-D-ribofuranose 2-oxidase n=1 Tax=Ferrithrix thermotolerans DSM 19514 TaxID=1121881 RepID=A0A1M4T8W2_9ACTN|nr:FAD-binding oxidoreductase [Ferrithrix thermotolerans]SHE40814.1 decaprenylphospho-beta-D-ribofuranose 2-oxidase [Ferrithrix thermotolerans DSM 19514]